MTTFVWLWNPLNNRHFLTHYPPIIKSDKQKELGKLKQDRMVTTEKKEYVEDKKLQEWGIMDGYKKR